MYINGVDIKKLKIEVENGYTPSSATILELIQNTHRYLFLSRCDSQIREEIALSEDMGAGWEYLDRVIDAAMTPNAAVKPRRSDV